MATASAISGRLSIRAPSRLESRIAPRRVTERPASPTTGREANVDRLASSVNRFRQPVLNFAIQWVFLDVPH